jgi:hypothetical protein
MLLRNGASNVIPPAQNAIGANSLPPASSSAAPLILHDSTPIRLRLNRNLSSSESKTGDNVDFEVLDDLKIDDVLLVARGATAIATVTDAEHKKRMARGGKLDVNIDYVRLVNGDKVTLRAVKDVKGGGHTGAMTGAMVATSLVFFPAAPFFLFMHGKDVTIPKGTEITAYADGEIKLERAKFVAGAPAYPVAQYATPIAAATAFTTANPPPPAPSPVVVLATPQPEMRIVSLAVPATQPVPRPAAPIAAPSPMQAPAPSVATQPIAPATRTDVQPAAPAEPTPAESKLELTITSDPAGAAVEINGLSVGATPITVAMTPGATCAIAVKKDGFVPWKMTYPTSAAGKFKLNANLTREVFR